MLKPSKVRFCLDARKVKSIAVKDAYPLPLIEEIFCRLLKALNLKMRSGKFHWMGRPKDKTNTLSVVKMPSGFYNVPQTMQGLSEAETK